MADRDGRQEAGEAQGLEEQYDALLEEAMRRPGIREVMEVYGNWRRADRAMDPHRAIPRWKRGATDRTDAR